MKKSPVTSEFSLKVQLI